MTARNFNTGATGTGSEIIPFDFEEQAVRVIMRDGEPWFVAADVCRVLEIRNNRDAVSRLDDDERDTVNLNTVGLTDGIRGNPNATIISESGLYALTVRSDKPEARRFRKWITAEVLPAIRKTGRYDHLPPPPATEPGDIAGMTFREVEVWLSMVREARITRGTKAGAAIWARSPLPQIDPPRQMGVDPAEAQACLDALVDLITGKSEQDLSELALRHIETGLFIGNASPIFRGTRWAAGLHRPLLLSLAGVAPDTNPRSLAGQTMRGIVLPVDLLAMGGV